MQSDVKRRTELGAFLRSYRSRIKPEQVGLLSGPRRRTSGLRREEAAQLAGIGLTWYTWLEQGREINVSEQVLDSLARAFMLTAEERRHLYQLANKTLPPETDSHQPVSETLYHILESLDCSSSPAYIMDQRWNVMAWNKSAELVFGDFAMLPDDKRNIVFMMFCSDCYMNLFDDWECHAKGVIARFRGTAARFIDDPWYDSFIHMLQNRSDDFRLWWSMYSVHSMYDVVKELTHPTAGKLKFEFVSLDVSDTSSLKLLVHTPKDTDTKFNMKKVAEIKNK